MNIFAFSMHVLGKKDRCQPVWPRTSPNVLSSAPGTWYNFQTDKPSWIKTSKPSREIVFVSQARTKRREKRFYFEPISFFEEHLEYAGASNGPHYISVATHILWCVLLANFKLGCSVNHRRCCILYSVRVGNPQAAAMHLNTREKEKRVHYLSRRQL